MTRLTLSEQLQSAQDKITELQGSLQQLLSTNDGLRGQIAQLDHVHGEAVAKLKEEHEKAIKSKSDSYSYQSQSLTTANNEIEQAHAVLDSVDGAPSREYEAEYGKKQRNIVTRLAGAFLAIAQKRGL